MNIFRLYLDCISVDFRVRFLCISFFSFILSRLALYFLQSLVFLINLLTVKVKNTLMFTTDSSVLLSGKKSFYWSSLDWIGQFFENRLKFGIDIFRQTTTKNLDYIKR